MKNTRIAFVGAVEAVSPWLLDAIGRHARLDSITSPDADNASHQFHARWAFADVDAMLRETEPDGVVLAVPFADRIRTIKHFLSTGVGVLVPGGPGPASACKRLTTFARLSGRPVLAAAALRFSPSVMLARRLLDSGQVGPPVLLRAQSTRRGFTRAGSADLGPVPVDQLFELFDVVHYLLGPLQRIYGTAHADGHAVVSGMSSAGVPISLVFHPTGSVEASGVELEIRAPDGARIVVDTDCRLSGGGGAKPAASRRVSMAEADPWVELGYGALVCEFARALAAGRSSPGLNGAVIAVMASIEALQASFAKERPIIPRLEPKERTARGRKVPGPVHAGLF